MSLIVDSRHCKRCGRLCIEYDTADASRIPTPMRAAFPRIVARARICELCDGAQHKPSEVRTFQLEAGMTR